MAVTLTDVARRAGVSTATVSRVLNNKLAMPIPQTTVERIRKAAGELNYTPNRLARALATRRTQTIGFFSNEITDPHGAALLDTIQAEARRRGYQVVVSSHLQSLVGTGLTDGLIAFQPPEGFAGHEAAGPVVHIYPSREPCPNYIGWSDYEGARQAALYFGALGHRRVASVLGAAAPDKGAGFAAGAAEAGLVLDQYLEQDEPLDYTSQGEYLEFFLGCGYRLTRRLLRERPETTALFARNDVLAAGILQALRDAGISVPRQVSVISYNDSLVAFCAAPPLTAIHTPVQEAGRLAVERLFQAIDGGEASFPGIMLPSSLVVRGSTAPLKQP